MKISRTAVIAFLVITIFVCALWALVGFIPAVTLGLTTLLLGFIAIWGLVTLLIPNRCLSERNLLSLLMTPLLFSIGAWVSSFTGIYQSRYIPGILGIFITIAVFLRRRSSGAKRDHSNHLPAVYWGWAIGVLALIPSLLVTLASQHISGISDIKLYNDVPWQIAMTSESLVRAPEYFPFIDGEKLAYPWSFHGFLGSLGSFSNLTASTLFTTVWPLYYTALIPLAVSLFSWRLTKSFWTSTLSPLLLVFFIGPTLPWSESLRFPLTYSISPTFEFGLIALLVFLIYLSYVKPISTLGQWASFFVAFATVFVASGSKGSNGLIVVTIMVIYFLQSVISKKDLKFTLMQSIFAAFGAVAAYTMTISGSSGNLSIGPLSFLSSVDSKTIPLMFVVVCLVWLIGAFFVINKYSTSRGRIVLPSFAAVASGVLFMAFFGHPGLSQIYFYWSVVPILAILGTWAIVLLFKVFGWIVLIPLISTWLIAQILDMQIAYFFDPTDYAKIKWPLIWLIGIIIFGLAIFVSKSQTKITRHFAALTLAGAAVCSMAAQPFGTYRQVYSGPQAIDGVEITADQLQAFSYIRDDTTPDVILASNRHCLSPTSDLPGCDSRYVSLSAFSERRVLIEGHFKETEPEHAQTLALNEAFIYTPDAELFQQIWDRGVRYIYIDKTVGMPGDLTQFGEKVYDSPNAQVWKLDSP